MASQAVLWGSNQERLYKCVAMQRGMQKQQEIIADAGGLVGWNQGSISCELLRRETATATGRGYVGGLVGYNNADGTITSDSYFDTDLSSATDGVGNGSMLTDPPTYAKTTAELQSPTMYDDDTTPDLRK